MVDAIVIGKGPAGISASLYLSRSGLKTVVVGMNAGALERAELVENYYGFPDGITGAELAERGILQAERLGVTVETAEVVQISYDGTFRLTYADGTAREARSALLATGKARQSLRVPGFEEFRGRGISFCATCDGFLYRGKRLGLLGAGDYAASEAAELAHFTNDITVFTNGAPFISGDFPPSVAFVDSPLTRCLGSDRLGAVETADGKNHALDGLFVALGTAGAVDFAQKIGVSVEANDVVVDADFMTNCPGLFAAGDCVGGFLQVAKAVSDGALAAKAMVAWLKAR
jgi:thioredoxin reductase (NADPH)